MIEIQKKISTTEKKLISALLTLPDEKLEVA